MSRNNLLSLNMLGTSFSIMTDEDPEYIRKIAGYLEKRLMRTRERVNINDPLKLSILTSIFIVDDLLKERNSGLSAKEAEKAGDLIQGIVRSIEEKIEEMPSSEI